MTGAKVLKWLTGGIALLFFSMSVQALEVNYFFCKKGLKSASEEAYVVDYETKYIYQVEYRPPVDAVKVTRFRLLEVLEHNIRGVIYQEYSGDYLDGGGEFTALPKDRIRKMVSLDMTKGVLIKLYTGAGDKYGSCSTEVLDVDDVEIFLKEKGRIIKNNVVNRKG
ncbi:MAG: hypothetical protein L3J89_06460 [Gammaproteobacteria bacterium]|nr:hypothetical protein [Gammaproteobacteria bacterium]